MNMTMQQPVSYPFYMGPPRLPWSSNSFHLPPPSHQQQYPLSHSLSQPLLSFAPHQQRYPLLQKTPSYSNTRYHNLKQSASYSHRRSLHPSLDPSLRSHRHSSHHGSISSHHSRPLKTKSVSGLEQFSQPVINPLSKAHSWHTMTNPHQSNLSVAYATEMHLTPKRRRKHSPQKKKKRPPPPPLPPLRHPSTSPKRRPPLNLPRRRSIRAPKCGVVRISTLDEMPLANDPAPIQKNSVNNDRVSMKGSITNSSKRQKIPKVKPRKNQINIEVDEGTRMDSDIQSSSSSSSSLLSTRSRLLQHRLNGSLRNDPLISAAMEDYRQHRRSSSQTASLTPRRRDLSRDSLRSDSTFHSSARSRSHSQSSFTSVERSEIRQLIKTIKTKDKKPSNISPQSSDNSIITNSRVSIPMIKPKKSSIAEELDREFNKLRALDPDQELNYVNPSSICKRKKTNEKPRDNTPPSPTFDQLLRQVQLRPIDKSIIKPVCFKEKPVDDIYENPLLSIPVPISSPIPTEEIKSEEIMKHEYAVPIKKTEEKSLPQICHFQPMRNFKSTKSAPYTVPEKRTSRPLSMFNWLSPIQTTFQPTRSVNNQNEYGTMSVKENIYTSDIDVYLPTSIIDQTDNNSLQIHLDNQTILTDDFYSEFETKQMTTNSSSILNDFSHLFSRKYKHQNKLQKKNQRCSIM